MVNVETNLDDLQQAIENADLEDLPDAISALEQAINNLNDALDGIPIYGPVTQTEDGLMTSADKIKLDELEVYQEATELDRKSTRLNSSHVAISYAVLCLKQKTVEEL